MVLLITLSLSYIFISDIVYSMATQKEQLVCTPGKMN